MFRNSESESRLFFRGFHRRKIEEDLGHVGNTIVRGIAVEPQVTSKANSQWNDRRSKNLLPLLKSTIVTVRSRSFVEERRGKYRVTCPASVICQLSLIEWYKPSYSGHLIIVFLSRSKAFREGRSSDLTISTNPANRYLRYQINLFKNTNEYLNVDLISRPIKLINSYTQYLKNYSKPRVHLTSN